MRTPPVAQARRHRRVLRDWRACGLKISGHDYPEGKSVIAPQLAEWTSCAESRRVLYARATWESCLGRNSSAELATAGLASSGKESTTQSTPA